MDDSKPKQSVDPAEVSQLRAQARLLSQAKDRQRALYQHTPAMLHCCGFLGRLVNVSDRWLERLGYQRHEVLGRAESDFFTEESWRRYEQARQGELPNGGPLNDLPLTMVCKDGALVQVLLSVVTDEPLPGETQGWLAVMHDITRQVEAEKALAVSEVRFKELVESIREVFWVRDPQTGGLDYISPAAVEIFGLPQQVMYDHPLSVLELVLPADRPAMEKALADHRVRGTDTEVEFRIQHPRGAVRWIRERAVCVRGPQGRAVRVLGVSEDVTERKQAQLAQAKSQEKFSLVFKNSPVWMVITSLEDGVFLDVNDFFTEVTGYTRGEVLGRTPLEVGLWPEGHRRKEALRLINEQGALRDFEIQYATKSGEARHALWSAQPFELEGRRCLISAVRDVSRNRMAETALRQANATLELAQKAARLGYWSFDPQSREIHWSETMFDIMGQDPAQGVPPFELHREFIYPEDWTRFETFMWRTVETGEPFDQVARIVLPDGGTRHIRCWALCRPARPGGPPLLFGLVQEASETARPVHQP